MGVVYKARDLTLPRHVAIKFLLLEDAGRGPEAAPYYERFISLWSDCDAALEPMVDDARSRRARL